MNPIILKLLHALFTGILIAVSVSAIRRMSFYQAASRPQRLAISTTMIGTLIFVVNLFWPSS